MKPRISILNTINIGPGKSWANVCWVFIIAITGAATFLLMANFSRHERVSGFLVADPQIMKINAPRAGRIQRIAVKEGQSVKRGDVLLYVDPDPAMINGKPAAETEISRLLAAEEELQGRILSIKTHADLKTGELTQRIEAVTRQIAALRDGLKFQYRIIEILKEQLASGRSLEKSGATTSNEMQRRESLLGEAEIALQNRLFSIHENEALLAELNGQKTQVPIERELKLSDLRQSLIDLEQRRTEAEGRLAFQVTAPTDGTIDTILTSPGQTIDASTPVVSILPLSSMLIAELYVPGRAIVFIERNQSVRIAYDAFPYTRYGFAEGKVLTVSQTILRPDEIHRPVSLQEPGYRITVSLSDQNMRSGNKLIRLRPGLTLSADIILDRQSLAQWIIKAVKELWART